MNSARLHTIAAFRGIPESALAALEAQAQQSTVEASEMIPELGSSSVALILSGSVLLSSPESEDAKVAIGAGEFFCGPCPGAAEITLSAQATERTNLAVLPWDSLPEAIRGEITEGVTAHALCVELGAIPLFRELSNEDMASLAARSSFHSLARGERLIREGEDADCFYVVARGSLEVYRENGDGGTHGIDVLGPGECVGEMAVLLHDKRSASVRARRQSVVIRVQAAAFESLRQHAPMVLHLAETLSKRLKQTTASSFAGAEVEILALLPWCDSQTFQDFCAALSAAFKRAGHRIVTLNPPPSLEAERYSGWLAQELGNRAHAICVCTGESPQWTEWAIRQADLILCVASMEEPNNAELPREVEEARAGGAQLSLVLLRNAAQTPRTTAEWLAKGPFDSHHHAREGHTEDFDRIVRRITGKAWGLVLGGGGARGLAHIGVLRAFREAGIPIDMIGGSSMGAILGAQYAVGWDTEEMLQRTRNAYVGGSGAEDTTLPLVSLRSGRGTIQRLREMFGDRNIEDLTTPYFCASCNLTRATTMIHDRGPLALWTRASCSIPGLLPPVPWNGDLLVDGAMLDNLPVDAMHQRLRGYVAASDVSVLVDLAVSPALPPVPSWSGFSQIGRGMLKKPAMPNIGSLLMRTAEISTIRDAKLAARPADLYLHIPVDQFSMSDFAAIDRIVALGYEYTVDRLSQWKEGRRQGTP